jgi:hypothetical protein
MKKIFIATCFAFFIFINPSCKKVLDLEPLNSFSTTTVWSSPNLAQVFVNEIYSEAVYAFQDNGFGWDSQTDELVDGFNFRSERTYNQGQATPDNQNSSLPINYTSTLNCWGILYGTIRETNTYFQNIVQLDTIGNKALISNLTGQVHFLRALCYFELLKRFGGVPIITKVYTTNDQTFHETRASWDSTANFILDEINTAVSLLPTTVSSGDNGKATVGAALALKSRLLLYAASPYYNTTNDMSKWQAAADAAKAVINLGIYSLYASASDSSTYHKIFTDFFNTEVIFAKVYGGDALADRYNTMYQMLSPNGYNGWSAWDPTEQLVEDFEMKDGTTFSWSNPSQAANPYSNREPRFYADILYNGAQFKGRAAQFWMGGLDSKVSPLSPWNASKTGYTIRKFIDESYNFNITSQSACQWVIFRLAEIYLNYAEAEAELGNTSEALTYLNKIRERAGMPDVAASGTDLIAKIQYERKIELCFEGHHYFDLRRWGIAPIGSQDALGMIITPITSTFSTDTTFTYRVDTAEVRLWVPSFYYYPIPRSEIQINPLIVQNPIYN